MLSRTDHLTYCQGHLPSGFLFAPIIKSLFTFRHSTSHIQLYHELTPTAYTFSWQTSIDVNVCKTVLLNRYLSSWKNKQSLDMKGFPSWIDVVSCQKLHVLFQNIEKKTDRMKSVNAFRNCALLQKHQTGDASDLPFFRQNRGKVDVAWKGGDVFRKWCQCEIEHFLGVGTRSAQRCIKKDQPVYNLHFMRVDVSEHEVTSV